MDINTILIQQAAIGDYLFLIIVVVASIIQAIVQNNKKKALQELPEDEMAQNDDQTADVFDRIPETMAGYETPVDNIFDPFGRSPVSEPDLAKYNWADDYAEDVTAKKEEEAVAESSIMSEEKSYQNTDNKFKISIPPKSVTTIPIVRYRSGIRAGFNLKKAVIYSEILNRKYT